MAAPRPFNIVSEITGLPLAGALGDMAATAWAWNGSAFAAAAAPSLSEIGGGAYRVNVTDPEEAAPALVLVETGHEPSYWLFAVFKSDGSNQVIPLLWTQPDGELLPQGSIPSSPSTWTGSVTPDLIVVADGVGAIFPSITDIIESATGTVEIAGALPPLYEVSVDSAGGPIPAWPLVPGTFSHESYTRMVNLLYPPGELFRIEPGTALYKTNEGIADELERVGRRGHDLIEETDPRTATETLPDWEKMLSLPDDVVTVIPGSTSARRVAVTQKYISQGGQDYGYFDQVCTACGYPLVSIEIGAGTLSTLRVRCAFQLRGTARAFHIVVTVGPATLGALTHSQFEAAFRKRLHAGITASFVYT